MRIELELAKNACKSKIPLDHTDFSKILDSISFANFYEFREADFDSFIRNLFKLSEAKVIKNDYDWQKRIEETYFMPVSDQIRLIRVLADKIKNTPLKNSIMQKYTRKLDFSEAIGRRLGPELEASRRTLEGEKPDGLKFKEGMIMLVQIGKEKHILQPVQPPLPLAEQA